MSRTISIQPVNSIVFVSGGGDFEVPAESFKPKQSLVAASGTCLIVGLLPAVDGATNVTFGRASDIDPGWTAEFSVVISTPTRKVIVDTVDEQIVHEQSVDSDLTAVKVWLSHRQWPDDVFIAIN